MTIQTNYNNIHKPMAFEQIRSEFQSPRETEAYLSVDSFERVDSRDAILEGIVEYVDPAVIPIGIPDGVLEGSPVKFPDELVKTLQAIGRHNGDVPQEGDERYFFTRQTNPCDMEHVLRIFEQGSSVELKVAVCEEGLLCVNEAQTKSMSNWHSLVAWWNSSLH